MSKNKEILLPENRPDYIHDKIQEAFKRILAATWDYNGEDTYNLAAIDEFKLIQAMIMETPNKKTFNILDVGAGNFQFGKNLVKLINDSQGIRDIKFNIFSVRGDLNLDNLLNKPEINENCSHYQLGYFQIENIQDELKNYNSEPMDLIVSRWTLRHLVDPLGTFVQIYKLLSDQGIIMLDGFAFSLGREDSMHFHENMYRVFDYLDDIGDEVLTFGFCGARSLDQAIIRKKISPHKDTQEHKLPFIYDGTIDVKGQGYDMNSNTITKFKNLVTTKGEEQKSNFEKTTLNCYKGSKLLYEFIQKNECSIYPKSKYLGELPKFVDSLISFSEKNSFENIVTDTHPLIDNVHINDISFSGGIMEDSANI